MFRSFLNHMAARKHSARYLWRRAWTAAARRAPGCCRCCAATSAAPAWPSGHQSCCLRRVCAAGAQLRLQMLDPSGPSRRRSAGHWSCSCGPRFPPSVPGRKTRTLPSGARIGLGGNLCRLHGDNKLCRHVLTTHKPCHGVQGDVEGKDETYNMSSFHRTTLFPSHQTVDNTANA